LSRGNPGVVPAKAVNQLIKKDWMPDPVRHDRIVELLTASTIDLIQVQAADLGEN